MRATIILAIVLIGSSALRGQTFQKKISWKDNSFTAVSAEWVDFDNDSLLDVVLVGHDLTSKLKISPFKNSGTNTFLQRPSIQENLLLNSFVLTDFNHDNRIDLIVSGTVNGNSTLLSYSNKQNFSFDKLPNQFQLAPSRLIRFIDLDQDGTEDLITASESGLKIFKKISTGYELKFDSVQLQVKDLSIRDFNKDGRNDLVISGNGNSGGPFLLFMANSGKFKFEKTNINKPISGTITSGDFDHNGKFDFIISGKNDLSVSQLKFFRFDSLNFTATDSLSGYADANLLLADFDSDGLADLSFNGIGDDGKHFNFLRSPEGKLTTLDTTGLINQRWGDFDRDGDLDILRVRDSADYHVFEIHENLTPKKNKRPDMPGQGFAVSTFNKTIISWGTSIDDHTPTSAITYDLLLTRTGTPEEIVAPDYRATDGKRLLVSHGKQTTNTFAIINGLVDGQYNYLIQPVDNAFNGGICRGGGVLPCFDLKHEYKQACKGDTIILTSPFAAMWFSNSFGLLEQSLEHKFVAMASDTIISLVPHGNDCSVNRIWVISVNGNSVSKKEIKYVCENIPFKLGIDPGWKNITWTGAGLNQTKDTVELKLTKPTVVVATSSSNSSCTYRKEFDIRISKPELKLNGEVFQIKQGESVSLEASGTDSYLWTPPEKLSSVVIPNPVASPVKTTEYSVFGTDSVGCTTSGKIVIQVEETAFIPTLFTPNNDGKNDELKIYGLAVPTGFHFIIFNREGSAVYETKDWSLASVQGWNGSHNGTQQPPGLYYWKVEGKLDGEVLRLNGKTNGSVLLVR